MKQTVTILTALMIALLVVSGFILMGSMRQSELLMEREDQLLSRTQALDEAAQQILTLEQEAQQYKTERDALSQQLEDALLSSQEANDAVAQQAGEAEQRMAEIQTLGEQLALARKENAQLQSELEQALNEAALHAMACEQQSAESGECMEKSSETPDEAASPTVFRVSRPVATVQP